MKIDQEAIGLVLLWIAAAMFVLLLAWAIT